MGCHENDLSLFFLVYCFVLMSAELPSHADGLNSQEDKGDIV
jgi:hypothetical protein